MLKGLAQDHFYSNLLSHRSFDDAYVSIRNFFEGPGYHRANLDKWNAIDLTTTTAKYPEKSTFKAIQMLINKLRQL
jgi:hypothetical protein